MWLCPGYWRGKKKIAWWFFWRAEMRHTLNWVGKAFPSSRANSRPPTDAWSSPPPSVAMCKCLPRHPLQWKPCQKKQSLSDLYHPYTIQPRGQAEWQIPLKQSQVGFRTPGEGAQQLNFGEQHCASWDWFVSICLVWSSAVTMAWHTAKRLLPLIAVHSYVTVLLTGGI